MEQTFFDYLGIADIERIHSQVMNWLLSLEDSILSDDSKSEFLTRLFKINEPVLLKNIECYTEVDKIDIFINSDKSQFLVENKLKSSEHHQTMKYIVPKKYSDEGKNVYNGFLTFIYEQPINPNWIAISFSDLLSALEVLKIDKKHKEWIFLQEYIQTVRNFVQVFKEFIESYQRFTPVFTDGSKKKQDKTKYDDKVFDFIRRNQLETILQKAFFHDICRRLDKQIHYVVGETRGNALIEIDIKGYEYHSHKFTLGLQIQGNTIKINFRSNNYLESKKEQIDSDFIKSFDSTFNNKNDYKKLNKPRTSAYLSVSKQSETPIYKHSKEKIIQMINAELEQINKLIPSFDDIIKELNKR